MNLKKLSMKELNSHLLLHIKWLNKSTLHGTKQDVVFFLWLERLTYKYGKGSPQKGWWLLSRTSFSQSEMNLELFPDFKLFVKLFWYCHKSPLTSLWEGFGVDNLHSILLLKDVSISQLRQCFSLFIFFLIFYFCVGCRNCFCTFWRNSQRASSYCLIWKLKFLKLFLYFNFVENFTRKSKT